MGNIPTRHERIQGCLAGLAVGDALGAPLISMKPGRVRQVYGRVDGYVDPGAAWKGRPDRWSLPGLYTGNTQKAIAIADILARDGACDAAAFAGVLVEMADARVEGTGPGCHRRASPTLRRALERLRSGEANPTGCGEPTAGSGAAARAAVAGAFFADQSDQLVETVIETSLVTHRDPRAVAAAVAVAGAVAFCIAEDADRPSERSEPARALADFVRGAEDLLRERFGRDLVFPGDSASAIHHVSESLALLPRLLDEGDDMLAFKSIVAQANRCEPDHVIHDPGDGFAPAAVTTALYVAFAAPSFSEAVSAAVGQGRQAHDLGAIAGTVAGARHGLEAIPGAWIRSLHNADQVLLRGENLARGSIDFSRWRGIVEMECDLTAMEARERQRLTRLWEKQGILVIKKRRKRRPEPEPEEPPVFAPPPEIWLRRKEERRLDRERAKREKRRRKR